MDDFDWEGLIRKRDEQLSNDNPIHASMGELARCVTWIGVVAALWMLLIFSAKDIMEAFEIVGKLING